MTSLFQNMFGGDSKMPQESNDKEHTERKEVEGKIIKLSTQGWGFISSKEIKFTRIFFHWTSLRQDTLRFPDLREGMKVKFVPQQTPGKGYRAIKVSVIKK